MKGFFEIIVSALVFAGIVTCMRMMGISDLVCGAVGLVITEYIGERLFPEPEKLIDQV